MQGTLAKIKESQQVAYAQHLAKQRREGRIRKVNEISENYNDEDYPGLSDKKGSFFSKTGIKRGQTGPSILNKSIDISSLG